jgi:hypothetical protein
MLMTPICRIDLYQQSKKNVTTPYSKHSYNKLLLIRYTFCIKEAYVMS